MLRFVRSFSADIPRLALGLVLTGASVSKLFAFHSSAVSLSILAHVPENLANPAEAGLIALECGTGLLLLSGKSIRISAPAALCLFVAFTLVLSGAIVRGVDHPCNCFGSLGPRLPVREEALLDLLLAAVAFFLVKCASAAEVHRFLPPAGFAAALALLWSLALILWPHPETAAGNATPVPASLLREESGNASRRPVVLLLADFYDFGCQLCLDDFLAFCDSLNGARFRSAVSVRLVARRDSARSGPEQARMIEGWAAGNRYLFPVSVDREMLFERSGVGKTSAIVLGADGHLVDIAHFPTGGGKRNELLRAIAN